MGGVELLCIPKAGEVDLLGEPMASESLLKYAIQDNPEVWHMWKGILLDPKDTTTCPACGQTGKTITFELCGECRNRCPDPEHLISGRGGEKDPNSDLCRDCQTWLDNLQFDDKQAGRDEFWVYAVQLDCGTAYYGHSYDPEKRYDEHFNDRVRQTSSAKLL